MSNTNKSNKIKKPLSALAIVAIDLFLAAAVLLSFCYFHHVRKLWGSADADMGSTTDEPIFVVTKPQNNNTQGNKVTTSVSTAGSDNPVTDGPITGVTDPGPTYDTSGDFGYKFGHLFSTDGEVNITDTTYQSSDIYMEVAAYDIYGFSQKTKKTSSSESSTHVVYYVMDVYVRNIENIYTSYITTGRTSFENLYSNTTIGTAVASISGDLFYGYEQSKPVIVRNGNVLRYSNYITSDICVLYWDGTMETVTPEEYDWNEIVAKAPYQIWSFGPELVDNGKAITDIESSIWGCNPRSAIGYVEPGHYVLVSVSGYRDSDQKSTNGVGMNLEKLAQIFEDAGCAVAYNLDGGASTYSRFGDDMLVSVKYNDAYRTISDIICIGEK